MNKQNYIVYKHTNLINNKIYIGITCHGENPNCRWEGGSGYYYNDKFYPDILQYGWDNFSHEILETNLDLITAIQKEREYISLYNTVENGYNKSPGGNIISEEGKKKISQALTGIKRKQESIEKQIQTKKNKNNGFATGFDPIDSNITKKVKCNETGDIFGSISEAENWANTSKISECCQGQRKHAGKHPQTGIQLSWQFVDDNTEITIRCIEKRETKKIKKIKCIETNEIFDSASDAYRKTGISICNILRVCNKQRKTAGKFHWEYYEEE